MKLYAISDRGALGGIEAERISRLIALCAGWTSGGVDYIQVREKDLDTAALCGLVTQVVEAARVSAGPDDRCRILVNTHGAVACAALEAGAAGVHLRGGFTSEAVDEARHSYGSRRAVVSVSCHSVADIERALDAGADLALFAPVFGKEIDAARTLQGIGLEALAVACKTAGSMPVFALGGVTVENAQSCIDEGAAGVAGIRLFQSAEWRRLR